jgi:LemA protein
MNKSLIGCGLAVLAVVVILVLTSAGSYNSLVGLEEGVESAWGQVENVYQRRADLVPNLVNVVKGAAEFEQDTLTQVTEARSRVGQVTIEGTPDGNELREFQQAQGELSSALSRLLVVAEAYPQLTATQGFRDLQVQLEGTENRIAVERNRYNEAAKEYNTARRRFPAALLAGLMGFDTKPYFEAQEGADRAPEVDFS